MKNDYDVVVVGGGPSGSMSAIEIAKSGYSVCILEKDRVIGMILSMVHNRQDAEDISQDVFVSVYFALSKFKGLSSFNTWLYRIVINKINAHYRKLKLRNTFNLELSKVEHMHFSDIDEDLLLRQFDKELLSVKVDDI